MCLRVQFVVLQGSLWPSKCMICVDIAKNALFTSFGIINFADSKLLDISRLHAICGMYVLLILVACAESTVTLIIVVFN